MAAPIKLMFLTNTSLGLLVCC